MPNSFFMNILLIENRSKTFYRVLTQGGIIRLSPKYDLPNLRSRQEHIVYIESRKHQDLFHHRVGPIPVYNFEIVSNHLSMQSISRNEPHLDAEQSMYQRRSYLQKYLS